MSFLLRPKFLLGMASVALVIAVVQFDVRDGGSPGPLSPSHAALDELAGSQGCDTCHGSGSSPMHRACGECHQEILQAVDNKRGLHGTLDADTLERCSNCHGEHHGDQLQLVDNRAFVLAGFSSRDEYDHAGIPFELVDAHANLDCEACHQDADAAFSSADHPRYLGLSQDCEECHENPHIDELGKRCDDCHGQAEPFEDAALFSHDAGFTLAGVHADLDCVACHSNDTGTDWMLQAAMESKPPVRTCDQCHETPHGADLTEAEPDCSRCHGSEQPGFALIDESPSRSLHAALGMELRGSHASVACSKCHQQNTEPYALRFPGRHEKDCAACHEDPHAGQFGASIQGQGGCQDCHSEDSFSPSLFDSVAHGITAFPLLGAHKEAACSACHVPQESDAPVLFADTPSRCQSCHDDNHRGIFAQPSSSGQTDCGQCHGNDSFALVSQFDHSDTGHPLNGAHRDMVCGDCHAQVQGGALGAVEILFPGDTKRCVTCHSDHHEGLFLEEKIGFTDCSTCHTEDSFEPVAAFDHDLSGFSLVGSHETAECATCHGAGQGEISFTHEAPRLGRAQDHFPGDPQLCSTCHTDPHQGVFSRPNLPQQLNGETGCARCHQPSAFGQAKEDFDHLFWTGFALTEGHANRDCHECHAALPRADFLGRTMEPAKGTHCIDCHEDEHLGQFSVPEALPAVDCARCHSGASFAIADFDHDAQTAFPLDEQHRALDCRSCHKPWPLADGTTVIHYKPLGKTCAECHIPGGGR